MEHLGMPHAETTPSMVNNHLGKLNATPLLCRDSKPMPAAPADDLSGPGVVLIH